MLGVDHHQLSELALAAPPGSDGLVLVPYLDGERTPNLPRATGSLHGLTRHNMTAGHVARAAVEGMLCGLAQGLEAMSASGPQPTSVMLIGGASTSEAVRRIAPTVFGLPVVIPSASEYVADGAARQAAWALEGGGVPPVWSDAAAPPARYDAKPAPGLRERYAVAAPRHVEGL